MIIIGEFQKNTAELVKVSWEVYKGSRFVDIRAYYADKSGNWKPTKKGIAIPKDKIESLIELLRAAQKQNKAGNEEVSIQVRTLAKSITNSIRGQKSE